MTIIINDIKYNSFTYLLLVYKIKNSLYLSELKAADVLIRIRI